MTNNPPPDTGYTTKGITMASYTAVTLARHKTAAAGVADSVDFVADLDRVMIVNRGTVSPIYFTIGGTGTDDPAVPTVEGDDCRALMPGDRGIFAVGSGQPTRVRLICAVACDYSVESA